MKKTTKRLLSVLLAFVMVVGIFSAGGITASAAGETVTETVGPAEDIHTFIFHVDGEEWETVILKRDEQLFRPDNPPVKGRHFTGWFEDEACTNPFDDFETPVTKDNGTTNLYAGFEDICSIVYFDNKDRAIISDEVAPGTEYTFNQAYPAFDTDDLTMRNTGWKDQHGTVHTFDTVNIEEDLILTPVLAEGYTVRFDTQGGEAVVSQFVPRGGKIEKPKDPTYKGYDFDGWYDAAEGGNEVDFNVPPSGNATIYAHWTPGKTEYCLVYKVQIAGKYEFTFHSSYLKTGTTGNKPEIEQSDLDYMEETFKEGGYKAYFYNEQRTLRLMGDETIAPDGSTVITVYMDRVWYTIRNPNNNKTKTVHWGENINNKLGQIGYTVNMNASDQYHFWYNGKLVLSYKPTWDIVFPTPARLAANNNGNAIPPEATLNLRSKDSFGGPNRYKIDYHYETLGSTPESRQYEDDTVWRSFKNANARFDFYSSEKWKLISTKNTEITDPPGDSINTALTGTGEDGQGSFKCAEAWYYRQKYDLRFVGASEAVEDDIGVEDIMWDTDISGYKPDNYIIDKTTKYKDGATYVFTGWYLDSACTEKFDFSNAKMPTKDLYLYSGWTPLKKTVTFDPDDGQYDGPEKEIVGYGKMVQEPPDPTKPNRTFLGWTLNGKVWNFASPVTDDMTLIAKWFEAAGYSLTYDAGDGEGSVTDDRAFAPGFGAVVKSGDGITPPDGKKFVYWKDDNGEIYKPGEIITILADTTLTAVYATPSPKVSLIYDLNYDGQRVRPPKGYKADYARDPETYINNSIVVLEDPTAAETPAGYKFDGWYLDEKTTNGSHEKVIVYSEYNSAPNSNRVYAKWKRLPVVPTPPTPPVPPALNGDDHFEYIIGYEDGTVRPEADITRAEVATIFFRLLKDEVREANFTKTNTFSDVGETDWHNNAISTLVKMGIINGYPDGTFRPNESITRAEFAAVAARFDKNSFSEDADFSDVSRHWASVEIAKAEANGWVNGYPDGSFKPNQLITRAEAVAIINRVLNRDPQDESDLLENMIKWPDNTDTSKWYYIDVQEASNGHTYERKTKPTEKWVALEPPKNWATLQW